jgi:Tol biopolymer transport system component
VSRVLAAVAVAAGLAAAGASARGPYTNGLVAFDRCCGPSTTGIYVVESDGTGEKRIYAPKADDAPLTPAWSPDGRQIAFVPGAPVGGLWVMQANGAKPHRIAAGKGDPLFPSWSADGRWIVFADLGSPTSEKHDIYVVRANGTGLKRLTTAAADESNPAWAPDGSEIVYARGGDLWRMNTNGTGQRLLVRHAGSPSWSPGATHLAFVRGGDPWIAVRNGGGAKLVLHTPANDVSVTWSPDGVWLLTSGIDRGDLILVRADGSSSHPLTDAAGYFNSWPEWQRLPTG